LALNCPLPRYQRGESASKLFMIWRDLSLGSR